MGSATGRRGRPLAILCALLMIAWGAASVVSLVVQIMNHNDFGWPDESADGELWAYVLLYLGAAASGCWVLVWGLFGLAWRPPLHLAALSLVAAVVVELTANVVQVEYFKDLGIPVSYGDQAELYVDRATFSLDGAVSDTKAFLTALPLVTAVVPLLVYLAVLLSGAGRKRTTPLPPRAASYPPGQQGQQPYGQPHRPPPQQQQPYQPGPPPNPTLRLPPHDVPGAAPPPPPPGHKTQPYRPGS